MSDIVKRLRTPKAQCFGTYVPELQTEAADEIERLRTALEWIAHRCPKVYKTSDDPHRAHVEAAVDAGNCARAAVSPSVDTKTACDTCVRGVGIEVGGTCDTTISPPECYEPIEQTSPERKGQDNA